MRSPFLGYSLLLSTPLTSLSLPLPFAFYILIHLIHSSIVRIVIAAITAVLVTLSVEFKDIIIPAVAIVCMSASVFTLKSIFISILPCSLLGLINCLNLTKAG